MRRLFIGVLTGVLCCYGWVQAQVWKGWTAHTSMRAAQQVVRMGQMLWVGTTGGLYQYSLESGEIRRFTPVEGLHGVDIRVITADPARGSIWIGYVDGALDRVDVSEGTVRTFLDIARARQFTNRAIYRLQVYGDTLFVNTGFGVVVFDLVREEVRDSYTQFGTFSAATATYDVLITPDTTSLLWVATEKGLVRAPLHSLNLKEPDAWQVEEGFPQRAVYRLAFFNGRVYAGTEQDAYVRDASGMWQAMGVSGRDIRDIEATSQTLLIMDRFVFWLIAPDGSRRRVVDTRLLDLRDALLDESADAIWVADAGKGLNGFTGIETLTGSVTASFQLIPDGPYHNLMSDLEVDDKGVLWAGGVRGPRTGFYRFDGQQWTNYVPDLYPELEGRSTFDRIHVDAQGNVWAGSEGHGLVRLTPDGQLIVYDHTNSTLRPAGGTASYVRIGGITSEPDGLVWVTNQFATPHINLFTPDETWVGLPDPSGGGLSGFLLYDRIFVDSYRQKWILFRQGQGLLVFDTGDDPGDSSDDRWTYIVGKGSAGQGLPGEDVRAVVEDRSGRVWIGTNRGIAFFFAPSLILSGDPGARLPQWPVAQDRSGYFLRDLAVNDMAVDPANRLWLASEDGAWLVEITPEGGKVVEQFTTENSPLFSNEIRAVAVNPRDGRVFFATAGGLLSWQGTAVAPAAEPEPLFVYPNPVRAREDGTLPDIYVEKLVEQTAFRILTVDGRLVRRLDTRGGRIRWDGRDEQGNLVPSGVYILVAVGKEGEGVAYGRVVIIR